MSKRIFCFALSAMLFALASSADAQQPPKLAKIGWLSSGTAASMASQRDEFVRLLHELGYIESKNIAFEYRYADNELDRLPTLAHELVSLKIDRGQFVEAGSLMSYGADQAEQVRRV